MSKNKALTVVGKILKITAIVAVSIGILVGGAFAVTNGIVVVSGNSRIVSTERAAKLKNVDCILVLGCRVYSNEPSAMLHDRVMKSVELYGLGASDTLFMTGDSRDRYYDETGAMSRLATESGVPNENIVTDRYGLSTYESIYRAAKVYGYKKIIIVTQKYHLYRALYIAKQFGIEAYGVASDAREYNGQIFRDVREIAARSKDFLYCILKPQPEYGMKK
ncbi:MAG: YdcF family protein [Clostridia bacterium]|nr:YdcF family protein [Clostridia bacterium]